MNIWDTLRGLLRRWYITVPGVLLAAGLSLSVWYSVEPVYERSSSQLLLPGEPSIPVGGNPFLYTGGLAEVADVVVLAVGSSNMTEQVGREHPGTTIEVSREESTSGPVVVITVASSDDSVTALVLDELGDAAEVALRDLQESEGIPAENRITMTTITVDEQSAENNRQRLVLTAGTGIAVVALTAISASLVDGALIARRNRKLLEGESAEPKDDSADSPEGSQAVDWPLGESSSDTVDEITHADDSARI